MKKNFTLMNEKCIFINETFIHLNEKFVPDKTLIIFFVFLSFLMVISAKITLSLSSADRAMILFISRTANSIQ